MFSKSTLNGLKSKFEQLFKDFWHHSIHDDSKSEHGNKLRNYRRFKSLFVKEDYLNCLYHFPYRSKLAAFRLSSHNLHIESGRHVNIKDRLKPDERLCYYCDLKICESEFHFLIQCPNYSNFREELLRSISAKYIHITELSQDNLFIWIMSNLDPIVISSVAKFLTLSFEKRATSPRLMMVPTIESDIS
jgi:hypothetical protein